jgi:hemerythrin-like domain-containing protein
MENKPIKRSQHILQLSKDHHFTLLFSWKIRQGLKQCVDSERIKKYVFHFWQSDMHAHFREEEEILFAPLKDDKVQKAIEEHKQIKEQIDIALKSSGDEAAKQLLLLVNIVGAHVSYEERELFPHLEKTLTEEQLVSIGAQLKDELVKDEYADEFWIKTNNPVCLY